MDGFLTGLDTTTILKVPMGHNSEASLHWAAALRLLGQPVSWSGALWEICGQGGGLASELCPVGTFEMVLGSSPARNPSTWNL